MTDTPAPVPAPAADGTPPAASLEMRTIASDLRGFVAAGKMTQAQADAALSEAGGIPGDTSPSGTKADVSAGAGPAAGSGGDVASAKAEIDRLTSGADPAWLKAYLNASDPGHAEAVEKMSKLHEAAYPEAAPAEDAPNNMGTQSTMPFDFEAHEAPSRMGEVQAAAREVIGALGIDESLARGAVQTLDRAVNQRRPIGPDGRMGAPTAMTQLELAKFETMLQQRWGSGYEVKMDAVERAIAQAGKHGAWLKRTILHAGPIAAVWACETLATQGARLAPGRTG